MIIPECETRMQDQVRRKRAQRPGARNETQNRETLRRQNDARRDAPNHGRRGEYGGDTALQRPSSLVEFLVLEWRWRRDCQAKEAKDVLQKRKLRLEYPEARDGGARRSRNAWYKRGESND